MISTGMLAGDSVLRKKLPEEAASVSERQTACPGRG